MIVPDSRIKEYANEMDLKNLFMLANKYQIFIICACKQTFLFYAMIGNLS